MHSSINLWNNYIEELSEDNKQEGESGHSSETTYSVWHKGKQIARNKLSI